MSLTILARELKPLGFRRQAPPALPDQSRPSANGRMVVKKRGWLGSLLFPIGVGGAILVVGVPSFMIWNIYSASEERRAEHEAAVASNRTVAETTVTRQVADGETQFVLRLVDGKLVRVIAPEAATGAFINDTILYLDRARAAAHQAAANELDTVFSSAFAGREADLATYADWFFDWGRSWRFLYEAIAGAVQEAARLSFSRTQITDAARQAVEAYLLRHYEEFVLKPGLRDQMIIGGVDDVLHRAHDRYRATVAGLDDRMQRFLIEQTSYVEELDGSAMSLKIDWDAEKWKAPRFGAEDRYLEPIGSAAVIGGSAVLGSMLQRVVLPFLARATGQVMASSQLAIGGAVVGSIEPGIGTAIGALAGLAIDWGLSAFQEYMERDDFIADNSAALDATIAAWKAEIRPEVDKAIDVWFDDTRAVVAAQSLD